MTSWRQRIARGLSIFAKVWLYLVVGMMFLGWGWMWYQDGFWAMWETLPWLSNWQHYVVSAVLLTPSFVAWWLAGKLFATSEVR
jgi:hypothetical protein